MTAKNKEPYILIVDDSKSMRLTVGNMLKEQGYSVDFAEDGIDALAKIQECQPDLILLDVEMPRMDGFELSNHLKKSDATNHIPIIFLTSLNQPEKIKKGFESGAVDYVVKPCNQIELIARVNTHLELKQTKELLIKKNTEQKELLHVLCHDLVNPLGAIASTLSLSLKKTDYWLTSRRDRLIKLTKHGLNIIQIIRELRYLEEKEQHLTLTKVNLKDAIEESCLILQQKFINKEIDYLLKVDENLDVQAEKTTFINSVLNNIFTNAIKFSPPQSRIEVITKTDGNKVAVTIRDFGIGMSSAILNNLFIVGKGSSRAGTDGEKGTGFGMPLIKGFVTAYGGKIKIKSHEATEDESNHGTDITLILKKM